jgi:hypothetical protein
MRKRSTAVLVLVGVVALGWNDLGACGDKFILVGRGVRFQRAYAAVHPASVLIWINAKSRAGTAIGDPQFLKSLKLAGHTVQTAVAGDSAIGLLNSRRYDIILADVADAAGLEPEVRASGSPPILLPILFKPARAEAQAAAGRFGATLAVPDRVTHVLSVIDDVMKARLKTATAASATHD